MQDIKPLLDQELRGLPEKYKLPILLCDLEGKTIKEVAQQFGWPPGTVASCLARGRRMLAKRLVRRGVMLSAGSLVAVVSQNVASAAVPVLVVSKTIKAASLMAAGQAATGLISVKVAALTEGVLQAMFLSKLKAVVGVLLVVMCLIGVGTAVVLGQQPDSPKKVDPEAKQAAAKQAEAKEAAVKAMQERLQGTWKCVSMQCNGVKTEPDLTHTIKGNTWESKLNGRVAQSGTFKLVDLDASPKQIVSVTTFADTAVVGEQKDKTSMTVFMLDGDTLMTCVNYDEWPKGFFTQAGDGCTAGQFKRVAAK
jgi:RNA polymerase sigma-70 factor (ECF subfamily)